MDNETFAWLLIAAGVVIAMVGAVVLVLARVGFSGFPGNIQFERDGVSIYLPIVASIVASILLTIIVNVIIRLR